MLEVLSPIMLLSAIAPAFMSAVMPLFMSVAAMSFMLPSAFMSVIDTFSVVLVVSFLQAESANAAAATTSTSKDD